MNFGDKVELPVVVQNQTDKDMAVDVAIRATNASLGLPPRQSRQETSGLPPLLSRRGARARANEFW